MLKKLLKNRKYTKDNGVIIFENKRPILPRSNKPHDKSTWSRWRLENYNFFKLNLPLSSGQILIDIGAGSQEFRELTSRYNAYTLDFFQEPGIDVLCDITKPLPFKDRVIDIAFLSNVLEHTPEPKLLIAECKRILKPGGLLIGTVPFTSLSHQRPYDYYRYTDINLNILLAEAGFIDIKIEPLGSPFNTYENIGQKFFKKLFMEKYSANYYLQKFALYGVVILYRLHKLEMWFYHYISRRLTPDPAFTDGYGFLGKTSRE